MWDKNCLRNSKDWVKTNDTTSRHNCSTNIDPGAKNDNIRSKQNL